MQSDALRRPIGQLLRTLEVFWHRVAPLRQRAPESASASSLSAEYRSLVEHAVYGICRMTGDGKLLAANPALVAMLGYETEAEFLAVGMAGDLYNDRNEPARVVEWYQQTGRIKGVESEWKRKDGTRVAVRLSSRPLGASPEASDGFEMMVEFTTERAALENQLRQAQKMEAIGQLTGGIAHDFNNLLTVIIGNSDLLADALSSDRSELRAVLADLQSAARRGADMARKLLGFSRQEELMLKPLDLGQVVAEASRMLRRLLPENVEVQVACEARLGAIRGDAGAIEQVLMNLVTNARDAMPAGGVINIETQRGWLDAEHRRAHGWGEPGEYAVLVVSDTGMGMDSETQKRVFEPFFTTKPRGVGTGLGMAMVYGLVKQQGGFVYVASEPGHGTTVRIYFPRVTEESTQESGSKGAVPVGGTETILVAEDEEAIRRSARRLLERLGYRVLLAVDGQEALEEFRRHRSEIQLIISDLGMPRLTGRDLFRSVRQEQSAVPFLLMTGYTVAEVLGRRDLDEDVPLVPKPWTLTELALRVREVLDHRLRPVPGEEAASVLVVDYQPEVRTLLRRRLELAGYRVVEATDGADALRLYRDTPTDVVLTDLVMPEKSGSELIGDLLRDFSSVKVVAMSGVVGDVSGLLREAVDAGALQTLRKPFTTGQLLDAIQRAVGP